MASTNRITVIIYTDHPSSGGNYDDLKVFASKDVQASDASAEAAARVKFAATHTGGKSITIRKIITTDVGV